MPLSQRAALVCLARHVYGLLIQIDRMADDESSHRKRKKASRHEHGGGRSERRRRHGDSRDHGSGSAAPQPTSVPWHAMQFQLIDCVNGYAAGRQEIDGSCIVRGQVGGFDMSSFSGLVSYVCRTFEIDSELRTVFRSGVRAPASPSAHSVHAMLALERTPWWL